MKLLSLYDLHIFALAAILLTINTVSADVLINEAQSMNSSTIQDAEGDNPDWIELFNAGPGTVNLEGWGLTDDEDSLAKWLFPSYTLDENAHMLLYASGKDIFISHFHTNFKIGADGESIILTRPDGTIADSLYTGLIGSDTSIGRATDGSPDWIIYSTPTPGASNITTGFPRIRDTVSFQIPGGFLTSSVTVVLSVPNNDVFIKYTTDGSEPVISSTTYTAPFLLHTTSVVRARAFKNGSLPGPVITCTYFINEQTTMPIISLATDPDNLFDEDTGIYVTSNLYKDWEYPGHIELFEADGTFGFGMDLGIQLIGGWARNIPMKSFDFIARKKYGSETINYSLFPDLPYDEYSSFVLRNNGQDWWRTYMRDPLCHLLTMDMDIDNMAFRPCLLFINGEYWGLYSIREKKNKDYLKQHHPEIDTGNLDIVDTCNYIDENGQGVTSNGVPKIEAGDADHYLAMMEFATSHDMTMQENYDYLKTLLDIPAYIDFYVAGLAEGRGDWPGRNMKMWRPRTVGGKWRLLFFDADCSYNFNFRSLTDFDTFGVIGSTTMYDDPGLNPPWSTELFRAIMVNGEFQRDFSNRYADCANTIFSAGNVVTTIRDLENSLARELPRHYERWSTELANRTGSVKNVSEWHTKVEDVVSFAEQRQDFVYAHITERFGFSGTADVMLSINNSVMGSVAINSITPDIYPWSGRYFRGVAVQLTALPAPGYRFIGWDGPVPADSVSIMLSLTDDIIVTALFEEGIEDSKSIVINEINYNSSQYFDPGDWIELCNTSDDAIDISNWTFKDENDAHAFVIPQNTILQSGNFLVLCADAAKFSDVFPVTGNYIGDIGFGFSGAGELVRLFDDKGALIDSLTFGNNAPWPIEAGVDGPTLSLIDPDLDNANPASWMKSIGYGSPGKPNDLFALNVENGNDLMNGIFKLMQNFPNPFNPSTTIEFTLAKAGFVDLDIYNAMGQKVRELTSERMTPGAYSVFWDGCDNSGMAVSTGIYILRLKAENKVETKRMLLMK